MSQITTHILDTSRGIPARNIEVVLFAFIDNAWKKTGSGRTNKDGRVDGLTVKETPLDAGIYKLRFEISPYYLAQKIDSFYPFVEITFKISGDGQHYHVPLLLNPFGYSTYRGS